MNTTLIAAWRAIEIIQKDLQRGTMIKILILFISMTIFMLSGQIYFDGWIPNKFLHINEYWKCSLPCFFHFLLMPCRKALNSCLAFEKLGTWLKECFNAFIFTNIDIFILKQNRSELLWKILSAIRQKSLCFLYDWILWGYDFSSL